MLIWNFSENITNGFTNYSKVFPIQFIKNITNKKIVCLQPNIDSDKILSKIEPTSNTTKENYYEKSLLSNDFSNVYFKDDMNTTFELDDKDEFYFCNNSSLNNSESIVIILVWNFNNIYITNDTQNITHHNLLMFEIQDEQQEPFKYTELDSDYNLTLVNKDFNFSCAEGYFGPNWEDWETYMKRREIQAGTNYKYIYDQNSKEWIQVNVI